jgi:hypothetical protein
VVLIYASISKYNLGGLQLYTSALFPVHWLFSLYFYQRTVYIVESASKRGDQQNTLLLSNIFYFKPNAVRPDKGHPVGPSATILSFLERDNYNVCQKRKKKKCKVEKLYHVDKII